MLWDEILLILEIGPIFHYMKATTSEFFIWSYIEACFYLWRKNYILLMHRLKRCSSQRCPFIYFDWLLEIDELSNIYLTLLQKQNFRKINIKVQNPSKLVQSGFMMQIKWRKCLPKNVRSCNWFISIFDNWFQIMKINIFDHRFQGYPWECMKSIRLCFK